MHVKGDEAFSLEFQAEEFKISLKFCPTLVKASEVKVSSLVFFAPPSVTDGPSGERCAINN